MGSHEPVQVKGEIQKQLDREIREMVSALTRRLTKLEHIDKTKSGSGQPNKAGGEDDDDDDDDDAGVRVITLAGSNTGATMKTGWDETSKPYNLPLGEQEMNAYVNSNFQAINNSLMLGGSYNCSDPGVHMNFNDYIHDPLHLPHEEPDKPKKKSGKKGKKGKKISSGSSSTSHEEHSD